jgi:hypothetical protein
VEYIYDLTDRYNDFKERLEVKKQREVNQLECGTPKPN